MCSSDLYKVIVHFILVRVQRRNQISRVARQVIIDCVHRACNVTRKIIELSVNLVVQIFVQLHDIIVEDSGSTQHILIDLRELSVRIRFENREVVQRNT